MTHQNGLEFHQEAIGVGLAVRRLVPGVHAPAAPTLVMAETVPKKICGRDVQLVPGRGLHLPAQLGAGDKVHDAGLGLCTVHYCTVLYCTVLYCTALYCTALYCTVYSRC